jgi:CRP/FNR family transcriptional regulator
MSPLSDLQRFEPFKRLGGEGLSILSQGSTRRDLPGGTVVLHKGQPVSGAYIVLRGRLRVFTIAPNGTEATLYFVEPGETCVLALNSLFNDLLYPAWAQAEAPTSIALIRGAAFRRLFDVEPSIRDLAMSTLSTLVFRLMSEVEQLHVCSQKQRLVHFLMTHANSNGELRMTQQHLARHLGTTREVVARSVGELVRKRLVSSGRGCITIRDLFGLRRAISGDARASGAGLG